MLIKKKRRKRKRGREGGERGREEDRVPLGPFRVISLEEGAEGGREVGGSFQTQVNPSSSWEAPRLGPTRLIPRPWTKLEAGRKWL